MTANSPENENFTATELLALGQLAGYIKAEAAQMILDADEKRKERERAARVD